MIFFLTSLVLIWEVNSMSLEGPAITRYDPCGLGVIYFHKISQNNWRGVLNFGLYSNLVEAEVVLRFENETVVAAIKNYTSVSVRRTDKHNLIINAAQPIPKVFDFFVKIDNFNANESDVPKITMFTINNVSLCDNQIKASQTVNSYNVTKKYGAKNYAHVCGRRALDNEELTSVRTEAKPGDWPWHVAIFVKDSNNVLVYRCGGSLISNTAIVTAGHCVHMNDAVLDPSRVLVVAGSYSHKDTSHVGRQAVYAQEIILHPAYVTNIPTADLAIIKVNTLQFTEYVQPICLWGPVYEKTDLFGRKGTTSMESKNISSIFGIREGSEILVIRSILKPETCGMNRPARQGKFYPSHGESMKNSNIPTVVFRSVVGFGSTELNQQSDVLRSTNTLIQNDTTCITWSPNVYTGLLNEFTFCAGYGPTSSINPRNGDSGGGLVFPVMQADHRITWFLRGVLSRCGTSHGTSDCDPSYYVVYTDIAPHYGWIYHHAGLAFRSNVLINF